MRNFISAIFIYALTFQPQVLHAKVDPTGKLDHHIQQLQGPLQAYMENRSSDAALAKVRKAILKIEASGVKTQVSPVSKLDDQQLKAKLEEVSHVAVSDSDSRFLLVACIVIISIVGCSQKGRSQEPTVLQPIAPISAPIEKPGSR